MTIWDRNILLVVSDAGLKKELFSELLLHRPASRSDTPLGHYQVHVSPSLTEALARWSGNREPPVAVVLDQSALARDVSVHAQWSLVCELAETAPVILMVQAECVGSLNGLAAPIAHGRIEVVNREGPVLPLVMALIARIPPTTAQRRSRISGGRISARRCGTS